jgi:hypothetical protein
LKRCAGHRAPELSLFHGTSCTRCTRESEKADFFFNFLLPDTERGLHKGYGPGRHAWALADVLGRAISVLLQGPVSDRKIAKDFARILKTRTVSGAADNGAPKTLSQLK